MTRRLRLVMTALVGLVGLAGAASFAPRAVPAAPPPVRLEGAVVVTEPSQNELVVVPNPSVDLGDQDPAVTTTTAPSGNEPALDESPDPVMSPEQIEVSADSVETSTDSPDDD